MASFVELDTNVDQGSLLQDFYAFMADRFPGWTPAAPNLETVMAEGLSALAASTLELAADVPNEIFMQFGLTVVNIPPLEASNATADTTWTMVDDAGYTIDEGTQIAITDEAGEAHAFEVNDTVVVLAGSTVTAAGEVHVTALEEGADANDLTNIPELLDSLDFVDGIALVGTTGGGADSEDPVVYRDRLASELQLMAPRPIVPDDFAALVRDNIPGVARAVAIDGYDPADHATYDPDDPGTWKERMVTVVGVDDAGAALTTGTKNAITAYLDAKREINFVANVDDPTFTEIDVTYVAKAYPTFDTIALKATVDAAIAAYLDPANWGKPAFGDDPGAWLNVTKVRYLEVSEIINRVDGVNYIESLQIKVHGVGALGTTDLDLAGVAPLTQPGAINGTVD